MLFAGLRQEIDGKTIRKPQIGNNQIRHGFCKQGAGFSKIRGSRNRAVAVRHQGRGQPFAYWAVILDQ